MTWTPRLQRLAATALAMAPLLLVIAGAAYAWSAHHARLAALLEKRATYAALIRDAPGARAEAERLERASAQAFFAAPDIASAVPLMQRQIARIVGREGGRLGRIAVELKSEGDEAAIALSARLSLACDVAGLTRILHALRQSRPLLLVTRLSTRAAAPGRLESDLVVVSYVRTP